MENTIIVPDVHGRSFWKDVLEDKTSKIIFLGDYVDPYKYEKISPADAITCLNEIIEFKKQNPERVVLLLGNHDWGYLCPDICCSRRDSYHYYEIQEIYKSNLKFFDLVHIQDNYLFSHAGLHKKWLDAVKEHFFFSLQDLEGLNDHDIWDEYMFKHYLGWYSHYRGWTDKTFGSIVWADVREYMDKENKEADLEIPYYQIFGHTQLYDKPIIKKHFACVDCRKIFTLNEIINYGKN